MHVFKYLLVGLLLVLAGCDNGIDYVVHGQGEQQTEYIVTEPDTEIWVESFIQPASYEAVDILWVIDGSCSMMVHESNVLLGIEQMMNSLPSDLNWRLKMITTGDGRAVPQSQTFPLTRGDTIADAISMYQNLPHDGMEKGFDAVKNYISYDSYAQTWLREDAAILTVFVSDEEEQSTQQAIEFAKWYEMIRPSKFLSFIGNVEPDDSVCSLPPYIMDVGRKYMEAVDYFLGTTIDICEADWSQGVADATRKIDPIDELELTHIPYEKTVVVFEDGIQMDSSKWTYDISDNMVKFSPMPPENSLIEVAYAIKYYNL